MLSDYIKIGLENITKRKLRTSLTALGVIISVASIILLVVLGNGLSQTINDEFSKMGTNRITVWGSGGGDPSYQSSSLISSKDVEYLEELPYFEYITPMLMIPAAEIEYRNQKEYVYLVGLPTDNFEKRFGDYDFEIIKGRMIEEHDKYGIIIGYNIWNDLYDRRISPNNNIIIKGTKFRVVGIMDEIGSESDDTSIFMSLDTLRDIYNKPTGVNYIDAQLKPTYDPDYVKERVIKHLERRRGDDNFEVMTYEEILDFLSRILGGITFVLSSIAFISLVVGSIGIMNSMFTNVLERTHEIGVMKSIGAKNKNILLIFLLESGIIGFLGGIIGIIIGQTAAYIIGNIITNAGFLPITIVLNFKLLGAALLFSILIGVIAGVVPSYRASKMTPVNALRYD